MGLLNLCEKILLVKPDLKEAYGNPQQTNFLVNLFKTCLFEISDTKMRLTDFTNDVDSKSAERDYVKCKS